MTRAAGSGVVLCVNSGSSSLKVAVFGGGDEGEIKVAEAAVERIGGPDSQATLRRSGGRTQWPVRCDDHRAALDWLIERLNEEHIESPTAVGHRVVHGGSRHVAPERVSPALVASLRELVPLAPIHMPPAIEGIEAVSAKWPGVAQIACFDTAFHARLPAVARRIPIPDRFSEVRRYGFHGLSYEYVLSVLGASAPPRLVIAHLGNGASLAAVLEGQSVDTTMGFTPTGGIPMGTRSGDLDPGVILYLARAHGLSVDALERLVDHEAGLLAVGGSSDMRDLVARGSSNPRARLAVELFGYAVRKSIGALAAVLGGLDLLVFTGGIGEHSAEVREEACRGLGAFGIVLDANKNVRGEATISAFSSPCSVRVMATDEDLVIARHVRQVLGGF